MNATRRAVVDGERRHPAFQAPYPGHARTVLILLFLAVGAWYLHWRIGTFNTDAIAFSLTLYIAEVFGFVTALLHIFTTWRPTRRTRAPKPAECDAQHSHLRHICCLRRATRHEPLKRSAR